MRKIPILCLIGLAMAVGVAAGAEQDAIQQKAASDTLAAQRAVIDACVQRNDVHAAQAAINVLLTDFAGHEKIADAIYNLAKDCGSRSDAQTCLRLHQYNVEHHPADKNAMWSQVEIIKPLIRDGDDAAVDAAREKLLSVFAAQETLPKEIYQIGMAYGKMNRHDRARQFYQYVTGHWSGNEYAIRSELAILEEQGQTGSSPAFDAALAKLLDELSSQPSAAEKIYKLGVQYGPSDKATALRIHQYNTRNSPREDLYTMWSQVEVARAYIRDRDEPAAKTAVEELISRFEDQPTLPKEVGRVAQAYARIGRDDLAEELDQYIEQYWGENDEALWVKVRKARALILKDDYEAAEAIFQKILANNAGDSRLPEAVNLIAERYYERALSEFDAQADGRSQKAEEHFAKALAKWELVIERFPKTAYPASLAYFYAGECCQHLDRDDNAIEYYEEMSANWPGDARAPIALFRVIHYYDKLATAGQVPARDAAPRIRQACQAFLKNYPTSNNAAEVRGIMEHWNFVYAWLLSQQK